MDHDVIVVKKSGQVWKIIGIVAAALAVCAVAAVVVLKILGKKKAAELEAAEEAPELEGADEELVEVEAEDVIEEAAEVAQEA